jgi:hypothetical protein
MNGFHRFQNSMSILNCEVKVGIQNQKMSESDTMSFYHIYNGDSAEYLEDLISSTLG